MPNHIQDIIKAMKNGKFKTKCPNCTQPIELTKASLFTTENVTPEATHLIKQKERQIRERINATQQTTEAIVERQVSGARSVNRGLLVERMLPLLNGFRFNKSDCRSLFDPIDYIIFDGLSLTGKVKKIYFAEVKSGNATVSAKQSLIAKRIAEKKVRFVHY